MTTLVSTFLVLGLLVSYIMPSCSMDDGDLNSPPHICAENSLVTEISTQPLQNTFYRDTIKQMF